MHFSCLAQCWWWLRKWAAEKAMIQSPTTREPTVKIHLRTGRSAGARAEDLLVPKIWPPMPIPMRRTPRMRVIQTMV